MALISHPMRFEQEGQQVEMRLVRNDGYAWGEITRDDGSVTEALEVERDGEVVELYDLADTDALELLVEANRRCQTA